MTKVDIRKIYVCEIAKQSSVNSEKKAVFAYGKPVKYTLCHIWDYDDRHYGLCLKVESHHKNAYKHILTNTIYREADAISGGQYVIIPGSIDKLTHKELNICVHLTGEYESFNMDMQTIQILEERINNKKMKEKENVLNKQKNTLKNNSCLSV